MRRKRTPEQIIGKDALTQLIFEGYEITEAAKCKTCTGLGYVVYDAAFDPYAVECPKCSGNKVEPALVDRG